jgi:hypothetical protein
MLIKQNYTKIYEAVIHEDSLEIEGEKKGPDYIFRIGDAQVLACQRPVDQETMTQAVGPLSILP